MSEELPEAPLTFMGENAARLHEIYMAYVDAGFPEPRAFELANTWLMHYLDTP